MAKQWRGGFRGGHQSGSQNDSSSCKGYGVIIGTCDAARERETSKELVNLLNQAIEDMPFEGATNAPHQKDAGTDEPNGGAASSSSSSSSSSNSSSSSSSSSSNSSSSSSSSSSSGGSGSCAGESIKDMLANEIAQVKQQSHAATQNFISINTRVKGLVMIKIMRKDLCPVRLVESIFQRVKVDKVPCSRHVVRMIPLQRVFYPNEQELLDNVSSLLKSTFPGACFPEVPVIPKPVETNDQETKETDDNAAALQPQPEIKTETQKETDHNAAPQPQSEIKTETQTATATTTVTEGSTVLGKRSNSFSEPENTESVTGQTEDSKRPKIEEPSVAPAVEATAYPPLSYSVFFKARNNNAFVKETVHKHVGAVVPKFMKSDYRRAKVSTLIHTHPHALQCMSLCFGYQFWILFWCDFTRCGDVRRDDFVPPCFVKLDLAELR